jgi:outer membrane murein-binding lipoprotein Lpp
MKKHFLVVLSAAALAGCGPSQKEYDEAKKRASELEAQIATLRAEVEALKFGPSRLLAQAKAAVVAKNDLEAKAHLDELLKRHPSAPERSEASALRAQIDSRIVAAEVARKREEERKAEVQRLALARAIGNMKKSTDEMKGITWVSHRSAPVLANYLSVYFGTKQDSAANYPIRLKIQYYSSDWLFVRGVTIKADDKLYEMGKLDFERDHSSGSVWEWVDMPLKDYAMLEHLMNAKRVVIRFDGDKYYNDFTLPAQQQMQLREVYQAWKVMGGKP